MHIGLTMILSSTQTSVFIHRIQHLYFVEFVVFKHHMASNQWRCELLNLVWGSLLVCLQVLGSDDVSQSSPHKSAKHVPGRPDRDAPSMWFSAYYMEILIMYHNDSRVCRVQCSL